MSHCVISQVMDTDDPTCPVVDACVVHTHWAPCPRDGEPASPTPLHAYALPGRDEVIAYWERVTSRQRSLVLHHGDPLDQEHDTQSTNCWCGPEQFPAVNHG